MAVSVIGEEVAGKLLVAPAAVLSCPWNCPVAEPAVGMFIRMLVNAGVPDWLVLALKPADGSVRKPSCTGLVPPEPMLVKLGFALKMIDSLIVCPAWLKSKAWGA